jgi:hypothetical protein
MYLIFIYITAKECQNKFRRTETGCSQDEKEIVDFN